MIKGVCSLVVFFIAGWMACDIIHAPYFENMENLPGEEEKNVLLELFTGHQCPNCPAAEATVARLKELYGEKLAVIAYHSGFFARTSEKFPVDYQTGEGSELETFFKVQYFPSGMVNRIQENQNYLINPAELGPAVAAEFQEKAAVAVELSSDFDTVARLCRTRIKVSFLTELTGELRLCVFLTEDSLVSVQSIPGNASFPNGIVDDYVHMDVFRESFNGTWGDVIFDRETVHHGFGTFLYSKILNDRYKSNNCHIIAFVFSESDKRILQLKSVKLRL